MAARRSSPCKLLIIVLPQSGTQAGRLCYLGLGVMPRRLSGRLAFWKCPSSRALRAVRKSALNTYVTLVAAAGERVVVAHGTLAKGNLTIAARASAKASATVPLAIGVDIPPEQVRDAVIDVFFVVAGQLAFTIPTGEGEVRLELCVVA